MNIFVKKKKILDTGCKKDWMYVHFTMHVCFLTLNRMKWHFENGTFVEKEQDLPGKKTYGKLLMVFKCA